MPFDFLLFFYLTLSLLLYYSKVFSVSLSEPLLIAGGITATIPVAIRAIQALLRRKVTIDLLASVALVFSMIDRQWGSVVFISLMITSARIFAQYTEGKARAAIQSILRLRPEKVRVKKGKDILTVAVGAVKRNDFVVVEAGDRIPVDGTIIEGHASIDQSSLTGESVPIEKTKADRVFSSTLTLAGSIIVRTEKIGKDTTLEKIINLVEHAQEGKAGIQTTADIFASWYVLVTFFGTLFLFFITRNSSLILSILLVTCADDIAIAIPLAFWAAIGRAAKRGIIIKGGHFLEGLTRVRMVVVDKTGTVTKGQISVHDIVPFGSILKEKVLKYAAFASVISKHPIAKAIFSYALRAKGKRDIKTPEKFREYPGKGVIAYDGDVPVIVGNNRFILDQKITIPYESIQKISRYEEKGLTISLVSYDRKYIGFIALADEVREGIKADIGRLRYSGIERLVMLTGDNDRVARRIADEIGIGEFHAMMMPEDKVRFVAENSGKHDGKLVMVGDGVNDAAALARADIGIAMGAIGSDAAIESSDIALMKDDFGKIREAINIGKYTEKIARENFIIWGAVNMIGLLFVFAGIIGPQGAAAYNFVTDFFPILNSFRVFTKKSFTSQ
jgi:heavy metal translocating P-type ATPase